MESYRPEQVNPHQSGLNKLLQFGTSARATKTAGSYGDCGATISLGVTSNVHPSLYIPLERGETGCHHSATKERFLIATGRPIQPHAELPEDFCVPEGSRPRGDKSPWRVHGSGFRVEG